METETHRGYYTTEEETTNKSKKVAWFTFWDNDFADKVELNLNDRELIQENGKWFVVKKKPKYPETYKECCDVLNLAWNKYFVMFDIDHNGLTDEENNLYESLIRLKRCRDAYWKIAGEQMGLGKPWEFENPSRHYVFTIENSGGKIQKNVVTARILNRILVFPTEEMRDAFYKNFKDLIENCKELL